MSEKLVLGEGRLPEGNSRPVVEGFLMIKKEVSPSAVSSAATTGGRHGAAPVLYDSVKRCFAELSQYRIELRPAGRCTTPPPSAVQLRWDISELSDNGN